MKPALSATGRPRDPLDALNPEAGDHPICTDPRELQAAVRAGERSWRRFPYYAQRFAERGERFTRSDSAWLASLARHGTVVVYEKVAWLGRVLAARGMPSWLLELHLGVLHAELSRAVVAKSGVYAALLGGAEMLREARVYHLAEEVFGALTTSFAERVGAEWDAKLPETGGLLAAAVADERAGIAAAVPSLAGWLTDPSRFPQRWTDAVEATLRDARAA